MHSLFVNRKKTFDGLKFGGRSVAIFYPFINLNEL